ncbi:hypothetical protein OG21DRAFT_1504757 [Imleria badia]|nr:hypothetical protein OG21DRAFT_1504757 [Imleria badia]
MQHTSTPSLLSSVTRTASLVLSGRTSIGTSAGQGVTRTFKSHDTVNVEREGYAVPLDDIVHSRSPSGDVAVHSPSPSPSVFDRHTSLDATASGAGASENPFVHPSERTRSLTPVTPTPMLRPFTPPSPSPFGDAHAQQAVQADLATRLSVESKPHARTRSIASRTLSVPPPRPLGLPPPPEDVPHAKQLQPTSQPVLRPPPRDDPEERQEVRWWHDWLCGCSEGPDRGGDNQAGRTNPFE